MLSQLENVNIAIEGLSQEIAQAPSAELYLRRCKAYATLKNMDAAFADCQKALELDGQHAGAHNYLAALFIQEGRYEDAEREATTATTLDPAIEDIFLLVAYEGNRLTKKIDAAPTAPLYNKRGVLSMQQGALEPARADLEKAISLDKTLAIAYTNLIDVLIKLSLPQEAEQVLDTISDADPYYQNDKTLIVKRWAHLERKTQVAPSEGAFNELTLLASVQESVPTLNKAHEYVERRNQQVAAGPPAAAPNLLRRSAAPGAAPESPGPDQPATPRRLKVDY